LLSIDELNLEQTMNNSATLLNVQSAAIRLSSLEDKVTQTLACLAFHEVIVLFCNDHIRPDDNFDLDFFVKVTSRFFSKQSRIRAALDGATLPDWGDPETPDWEIPKVINNGPEKSTDVDS
jgi:hypothetical protein